MNDDRVECRTPNAGRFGSTRVPRWKFDMIREAILAILDAEPDGVPFAGLAARVQKRIPVERRTELGSIGWHTTTVKLELEVRGEIERVPDSSPQILRRPAGS